jgi:hypothetical protein
MKTLVWQRLDVPGMEIAHVDDIDHAAGTQIGRDYELRWRLHENRLELELNRERSATVELGDADFFDLYASPFFNSLPVIRDALLSEGPARDYVMTFIRAPELTATLSKQRYEPKGGGRVHYSSGTFATDIEFDSDGFVTFYHGSFSRIS